VVTVADGTAAVEMHQREVFDLIVVDLSMPRLNGIQVAEEVRANLRGGEIPILLVTAWATDEDRVQAHRAGTSGLMDKPFKPADLRNRVSALLMNPEGASESCQTAGDSSKRSGNSPNRSHTFDLCER
jgi:DNA-binding response OmpR family regulator